MGAQRLEEAVDAVSGETENHLHAPVEQALNQQVGHTLCHVEISLSLQLRRTGAWATNAPVRVARFSSLQNPIPISRLRLSAKQSLSRKRQKCDRGMKCKWSARYFAGPSLPVRKTRRRGSLSITDFGCPKLASNR